MDIWERWNAQRFELLQSVGHQPFDGFLNCYPAVQVETKNGKRVEVAYIEVYCRLSKGLVKFLLDSTKAYLRFDSGGAGRCAYYTVGYRLEK
jgi:hypothetical protein